MRNKATKKNMDLDLRRYGNNLYSKAEQSGGSGGGDEGGGGTVDYEGIYQFYKQQLFSMAPPDVIEALVIPEHFEDIVDLEGEEYESGTMGVWSTENQSAILANEVSVMFTVPSNENTTYIVLGEYQNTSPSIG